MKNNLDDIQKVIGLEVEFLTQNSELKQSNRRSKNNVINSEKEEPETTGMSKTMKLEQDIDQLMLKNVQERQLFIIDIFIPFFINILKIQPYYIEKEIRGDLFKDLIDQKHKIDNNILIDNLISKIKQ